MFYTKEQVDLLKQSETIEALKALTKQYNLEEPLTQCWVEIWPVLDELTNTLLYLEDHLHRLSDPRYALQNEALLDELDEEFKTNYG
jgi:Ser/Thr protein kinase RdoA (MazF antagonist)